LLRTGHKRSLSGVAHTKTVIGNWLKANGF
jgi:hypothetical protein